MNVIQADKEYGIDNLIINEMEAPPLRNSDVRVRTNAGSINYLDILVAKGTFNNPLPHTIGSDVSGEVIAVGSKVNDFKEGDRLISHYTQNWQEGEISPEDLKSRLGVETGGIFSETVTLPASSWVKVPENLTFEEASTLPIAGLTAWESLMNLAKLKSGEKVYLQGSGGVSIFALQFAKAAGAEVIITSGNTNKIAKLLDLGADHVINYSENDVTDEIMAITNGRGVDVALDVVGKNLGQTIEGMAFKGRIVAVGFLGGAESQIDATQIIQKNLTIQGVQVGSRKSFEDMNRFIEQHNIKPEIDKAFDFKDFKQAIHRLQNAQHFGKIVLHNKWS